MQLLLITRSVSSPTAWEICDPVQSRKEVLIATWALVKVQKELCYYITSFYSAKTYGALPGEALVTLVLLYTKFRKVMVVS